MSVDPNSIAARRALRAVQKREYEQQSMRGAGAAQADYGNAGPPHWDRGAWDAFKAQYGHYPYGIDSTGGMVYPPSFEGAPDFVYEYMGLRRPPVSVSPQ